MHNYQRCQGHRVKGHMSLLLRLESCLVLSPSCPGVPTLRLISRAWGALIYRQVRPFVLLKEDGDGGNPDGCLLPRSLQMRTHNTGDDDDHSSE